MFFLILVLIESLTLYISPVMGLSLVSIFVMASILSMIILSIGQNSETPGFKRNIPLCIIKVVCFIMPIFLVHFWAGSLKPVTHDIEYKFATFNCSGEVSSNNLGQCYMKLENEADSDMLSIETSASDADIGGMNNYDPIVLHPLGIARPDFEKDHPYAVGIRDWISMSSNEIVFIHHKGQSQGIQALISVSAMHKLQEWVKDAQKYDLSHSTEGRQEIMKRTIENSIPLQKGG